MSDPDRPYAISRLDETIPRSSSTDVTLDWSSSHPGPPARPASPRGAPPTGPDRYRLLAEIARGGMGVIYRATDTALTREVAVKVLQDRCALDSGTARRFADEARITARLQHPGVPPVHDLGVLPDGRPFLAMKLIHGRTLDDLLKHRPDPAADRGQFVAVFDHVCQAVACAHAHRVVHRDLKPANVMVGSFGDVQVMDWGLAKVLTGTTPAAPTAPDPDQTIGCRLWVPGADVDTSDASFTQAGSMLGTLAYMPPEQAAGELDKIGPPSDVFGLGAILAVILTGRPPYTAVDTATVRVMALRGDLAACSERLDACGAEPELVALCKRCLAFDPAARPPDAGAVAVAIAALRAASEERARTAERERAAAEARAVEQRLRRRWQAALAAAAVLILALLAGGAWWADRQSADRARDRAVAAERDRQEALSTLAHAEGALAADDLDAATQSLALAERRLGATAPTDLAARLARARRDRDLVRGLREIEGLNWLPGAIGSLQPAEMAVRYQDVFARYGLDVAGADPVASADAVRASRVSDAVVAGLSEWFCADPAGPHLRPLLDRLDPAPDRVAIRAAIQAADADRVRALVTALDPSRVPAWFAASIGFHPIVPPEDGVRLMTAAWRAHPTDCSLAYRCSRRLWGTQRRDEMLGWAKVAVALRPESPFAHAALALAWAAMRRWDEAEASARRVMDLGRNYPGYPAPAIMGSVLMEKGDFDGAEVSYRAALAIAPDSGGLLYNIGLAYQKREDCIDAEEWLRKAVAAQPTQPDFRLLLDNTVQARAYLERVAAGRVTPPNPTVALRAIKLARHPSRCQYLHAAMLYDWIFRKDPALANDLANGHRYEAARCAVPAAAGRDKEFPDLSAGERTRQAAQAMKWLRADLAQLTIDSHTPQRHPQIRQWLTRCKQDPDLAPIRDPAALAAMPADDRQAWQAFWREVDALLASIPE